MAPAPKPTIGPDLSASNCTDALTQYRIDMIEQTLDAVRENLIKLAALEQKHLETKESLSRAFNSMQDMNDRLRSVEAEMPTLKLVRGWVIAAILGILSLLGVALFKLFTISV